MKIPLTAVLLLTCWLSARAEIQPLIPIWPDGAPGALGKRTNDIPTITPYLPDGTNATGTAIVVCPGGGYQNYSAGEGNDLAQWLVSRGITCFVLRYRIGSDGYRHPAMFQDATRAMQLVRARAADWNINPKRIGILGASAGGHLAGEVLTHYVPGDRKAADIVERQTSRPDFGILCYAMISLGEFSNKYVREALLGANPPPELVKELSSELHVTTNTPPCFIWATFEDNIVPAESSLMFAAALRKNNVPFDLHIYAKGSHGTLFGNEAPTAHPHPWVNDCEFWLKQQGLN
jgi:acetyl esterase/lipase